MRSRRAQAGIPAAALHDGPAAFDCAQPWRQKPKAQVRMPNLGFRVAPVLADTDVDG